MKIHFYLVAAVMLFMTSLNPAHTQNSQAEYDKELIYRVGFGNADDIAGLLHKGANPDQVNEIGSPLASVAAGRFDGQAYTIVEQLIKAGANINQGGQSNFFPIVVAARRGDATLVELLLKSGADVNVTDGNGVTAIDIARFDERDDIVTLMQEYKRQQAQTAQARISPEKYNEHLRESIYGSCAMEYMRYYFAKGMGRRKDGTAESHKNKWVQHIQSHHNPLASIFYVDTVKLLEAEKRAALHIRAELQAMLRNSYRRRFGVGKESDLEKRCGEYADNWMKTKNYFPSSLHVTDVK